MQKLLDSIAACQLCKAELPHAPRPVVRAHKNARLMIIGQAPGRRVHESGVPWDDPSGDRLRDWLQMDKTVFYSPTVAIVPMGFCFPGTGKSGDLPPQKECAPAWHESLLEQMPNIEVTLLIGAYAQKYYLPDAEKTITATVQAFDRWSPDIFVLPHPSPRNNIWLKKNPWFEQRVLPDLRSKVTSLKL